MLHPIIIHNNYHLLNEQPSFDIYRTFTAQTGEGKTCVVKLLALNDKNFSGINRIIHECEATVGLRHISIVKMLDFGREDDYFFLVQEPVEGTPLSVLAHKRSLSEEEACGYIRQLADVLHYAVSNNISYFTIMTDHVMIDATNRLCKVIDFGLNLYQQRSDVPLTMFKYMSPEQVGIIKRPIDVRSGLYSLGVVFYEIITGQLPFEGDDVARLMYHLAAKSPSQPADLTEVNPVINRIIMKLIAKEPSERYQTISGFLYDLDKALAFASEKRDAPFQLGLRDMANTLNLDRLLVGNQEYISRIVSIIDNMDTEQPDIVMVTGDAGTGKSTLINVLQDGINDRPLVVMTAKGSAARQGMPLSVIRQALESFKQSLLRLPLATRKNIKTDLQQHTELGALTTLVPEFSDIVTVDGNGDRIVHPSTLVLFLSLVAKTVPVVMIVEDLEYCDFGSLAALSSIIAKRPPNIIFIFTNRESISQHEKLTDFLVNRVTDSHVLEVKLENLSQEQTGLLCSELLGHSEGYELLTNMLFRATNGNPLLIREQLHELIEAGIFEKRNRHWNVDTAKLRRYVFNNDQNELYYKRFLSLSGITQQILALAALFGQEFRMSMLTLFCSHVSPESTAEILSAIHDAEHQQLLVKDYSRTNDEYYVFCSKETWRKIYEFIIPSERMELHLMLAQLLERQGREEVFMLAWHYSNTMEYDKAIKYLLSAAQISQKLAVPDARTYIEKACEIIVKHLMDNPAYEQQIPSLVLQVHEIVKPSAITSEHIKDLKMAEQIAIKYDQKENLAYLYYYLAEIYHFKTDIKSATQYVKKCLPLAEQLDKKELLGLPYLTLLRSQYFIKTNFEESIRYAQRALTVLPNTEKTWVYLCNCYAMLGNSYAILGDKANAYFYAQKAIELAQKNNNPAMNTSVYHHASIAYNIIGIHEHGLAYAKKTLSQADKTENMLFRYCAHFSLGLAYDKRHDFIRANENFYKALRIAQSIDTKIGVSFLYGYFAKTLLDCQWYDEALDVIQKGMTLAQEDNQQFIIQMLKRSLGRYYAIRRDYKPALKHLQAALTIAQQIGVKPEIAACYYEYGFVLKLLEREEGEQYIEQAFSLFEQMDFQWHINYYQNRLYTTGIQAATTDFSARVKDHMEMASIFNISQLISSILDIDELLPKAVDLAIQTIGATQGVVLLLNDAQEMEVRVARNNNCQSLELPCVMKNIAQEVLRSGEGVVVGCAEGENALATKSVLCTPLKNQSKLLGLLYLDNSFIVNLFTQKDLNLMDFFAMQLAICVDNAVNYRKIQETCDELQRAERHAKWARNKLAEWNKTLEQTVIQRTAAVQNLLNNASQGFLSFGQYLLIEEEYSAECRRIFEERIENKNFSELLFPEDRQQQKFLESLLVKILRDKDEEKRQIYFPLLPSEVVIKEKNVRLDYKIIEDKRQESAEAFMIILTDITEKRQMETRIEQERNILKMVVKVVVNRSEFKECLHDYQHFYEYTLHDLLYSDKTVHLVMAEVFRHIHTLKGNFSQFEMVNLVPNLHQCESKLTEFTRSKQAITMEQFAYFMNKIPFDEYLEQDLTILRRVLGSHFWQQSGTILVDNNKILKIEEKMRLLLSSYECRELLPDVRALRYQPFNTLLKAYPEYVERIAERIEKAIEPLLIDGGDFLVDPSRYHGFCKTLVHVFRNAIDHGIEEPEDRLALGKDENGNIVCRIQKESDKIRLTITDDGQGIDCAKVLKKAEQKGFIDREAVASLSEEEALNFIFADGFSTQDHVTELSGRGVGLAAVRAEVEEMGGTIRVSSSAGQGTRFIFELPAESSDFSQSITIPSIMRPLVEKTREFMNEYTGEAICACDKLDFRKTDKLYLRKVTAFITIRGVVEGLFVLSLDEHLTAQVVRNFVVGSITEEEVDQYMEDVLAECANIIVGNSIRQMPELNGMVAINSPITIFSGEASIKYLESDIWTCNMSSSAGELIMSMVVPVGENLRS